MVEGGSRAGIMSQAGPIGSSPTGPGEERSDPVARVKRRLASALIYPPVLKSIQGARVIADMEEALAEAEGLGLHHSDAVQLVRNEIGAIRRLGRGAVQAQETLQVALEGAVLHHHGKADAHEAIVAAVARCKKAKLSSKDILRCTTAVARQALAAGIARAVPMREMLLAGAAVRRHYQPPGQTKGARRASVEVKDSFVWITSLDNPPPATASTVVPKIRYQALRREHNVAQLNALVQVLEDAQLGLGARGSEELVEARRVRDKLSAEMAALALLAAVAQVVASLSFYHIFHVSLL